MSVRLLQGDCRDVLPTLEADSFDACVTSPPYFGLRSYLPDGHPDKAREIGLEPTLDGYVETMVGVFREVRRLLKPTGCAFLNLGDSYAATSRSAGASMKSTLATKPTAAKTAAQRGRGSWKTELSGLKPKDLCGVPWRVAFALQADGWWLRSAIVWHKPNPMPESVTDRPTSAYEMVFLLTKRSTYFYDAEAIAEESVCERDGVVLPRASSPYAAERNDRANSGGYGKRETRNARNLWTIASQPFAGSHFATMPPSLAERCILAGCPPGGHVLDPFSGAGTTGLVADRLGRDATLIELNPAYRSMGADRISNDAPLFAEVSA